MCKVIPYVQGAAVFSSAYSLVLLCLNRYCKQIYNCSFKLKEIHF